ncbi:MAG: hypothetical protein GX455_14325 [Phycisphaerae bacterium]|nr:hypothetical protein [Phycisphaerae bacterium]
MKIIRRPFPLIFMGFIIGSAVWADPIIADHTAFQNFDKIPPYWLEKAKELTLHYAHTSHGSQIVDGIKLLETLDRRYSVAVRESGSEGLPALETPPALRIYDGNPPETYIEPGDYWDGTSALNRTRAVAATGKYNFSMWSWCGQQSSNSIATTQRYLDNLNQLETEFPAMRFIYMTGHTDGTGEDGKLNQRNNQVRQYCRDNGKVLFDFADIESYDPDGNYYLDKGTDDNCDYSGGNWATQWCTVYPGSPLCKSCSCAHSQPLNCNMKARAFWWMMARLAGWDGTVCPDLDGDSFVNLNDFAVFGERWLSFGYDNPADLTGDSSIDEDDLTILVQHWLQPCPTQGE